MVHREQSLPPLSEKAVFQRKRPPPPPSTMAGQGLFQRKRTKRPPPLPGSPEQGPCQPLPIPEQTPRQPPAPPSPPKQLVNPLELPSDLQRLGNRSVWEEFSTYFRGSMGPIVICGPTGCGKTEGIRSYLKRNGFMCAEVDVSDFNCPKELDTLLGSTISRSIRGSWALVVDDVEGILAYPQYASVLMKRLENQQRVCHTRIILTCNDLFSADMRPIKALIDKKIARSVCMYAPSRSVCLRYFVSYPKDWVLHATNDGENDLRQTKLFLESCLEREALRKEQGRTFEINSEPLDSHVDRSINLFSSFNQLVNRISTVDEWIRDTGDLTEWMTYSNYPLRVGSGLDSLAGIADVLSISEAQPRHFKDDLFGIGLQIFPTPTRFPPKGTLEKYPRKRERLDLDMPPIFAQECARKVDSLKVFKT